MKANKSKNIDKNFISNQINKRLGISKKFCDQLTNDLIKILITIIFENKSLNLKNFGVFKIKFKKSRIGRNPKNKQEFKITKRNVVLFKSSKTLNVYLNK